MIQLIGTQFSYPNNQHAAAGPLDLTLKYGHSYALLGRSGCGKSTILDLIAGFIQPDAGHMTYANNLQPRSTIMFQKDDLLPWKTVAENIALGLKWRQVSKTVINIATDLGLSDILQRYPHELSGGQCRRAALARSLIRKPELLLLDEPFASLDPLAREKLYMDLKGSFCQNPFTLVLVTHDVLEAAFLAQYTVIIDGPPATVVEVVENPVFEQHDLFSTDLTSFARHLRQKLATAMVTPNH